MSDFHLLRPWWWLAWPVLMFLLWWSWHRFGDLNRWRRICDEALLDFVIERRGASSARGLWLLGAALATIAIAALSGPAWRSAEQMLYRETVGRVIVLDLSPSMDAIDLVPSRVERARHEVADILRSTRRAQLGMVVFGADAFVVAPVTEDAETLVHLLAHLDTEVVPRAGSRPDLALAAAADLLESAELRSGELLLITDDAGGQRSIDTAEALRERGYTTSVLAVGTRHGAPIRLGSGELVKDKAGAVVVPRVNHQAMRRLAAAGGGRYGELGGPAMDGPISGSPDRWWLGSSQAAERRTARWRDEGPWLVLALLPIGALMFRRGWLLGLGAVGAGLHAPAAPAFDWADLWLRPEQQVYLAHERGDYVRALTLSTRLDTTAWYGVLAYRLERFELSAAAFADADDAVSHFNLGNALAMGGALSEALAAYEVALAKDPDMADAAHNWEVVSRALRASSKGGKQSAQSASSAGGGTPQRETSPTGSGEDKGGTENDQDTANTEQAAATSEPEQRARRPERAEHGEAGSEEIAGQPGDGAREDELSPAERRQLERWLASLPDDPGILLRNRFMKDLRARPTIPRDTGPRW